MTLGPLKLHTSQIQAINFLNGLVVAGSEGATICVCNIFWETLLGPVKVHSEGEVRAVAFSPDGNLIATGSYKYPDINSSVYLWDASTGSSVIDPLTDIGEFVSSIRFSPDGTRIVSSSSSRDKNVVVWDVSDGNSVFGYLTRHSDSVDSVAYSPNGALIASGSDDKTIILWCAYRGEIALGPLVGHSDSVNGIELSPDSTRLVSGSSDRSS